MGWLSVSTAAGAAFSTTLGFLIEVVHTNRHEVNEARNQDDVSRYGLPGSVYTGF